MSWLDDYFASGHDLIVNMTATTVETSRCGASQGITRWNENGHGLVPGSPCISVYFATAELKFHEEGIFPSHYIGRFESVSVAPSLHTRKTRIEPSTFQTIIIGKKPGDGCYLLIAPDNILEATVCLPKTDEIDACSIRFLYTFKIFHSALPISVP